MTTEADGQGGRTALDAEAAAGEAGGVHETDDGAGAEVVTVLMTAPDAGSAGRIVGALLGDNLVACGNILPGATSVYRWEGAVQQDEEAVVIMKTLRRLAPQVLERAVELHPYDVPELLVQPVTDGAAAYLDWVRRECALSAEGGAKASRSEASS